MAEVQDAAREQDVLDQAVAQGGAYEVLKRRLQEQGSSLQAATERLNTARLSEFGSSQMEVIGRVRIHTENNCLARDIISVAGLLVFGYNVFFGLRKETQLADVFSLYRLVENEQGYDVESVPLTGSFLDGTSFKNDFDELYTYYKNTRLIELTVRDGKLLAGFQIGERITDRRVFRWEISGDGKTITYLDNRGERDLALPTPFDFEWQKTTREMTVQGRHPHINILDTVFVETVGGDLTVKVENNTQSGQGIYSEPVIDKSQSLDDAQIEYAQLGGLILLRILPYREEQWRYLIFNTLTEKVERIDEIGISCRQLPEDHGLIFPGGYYLQNGDYKKFEQPMEGMRFKRVLRSPNGEDVQYVFYHPEEGRTALFTYNMISRQLQNPIFGHGQARFPDGRMVIFFAEGSEATRVHPMQVWSTPFCSEEYAASQPAKNSFYGRLGNAELVRGISDLYNLAREINNDQVSITRYQQLSQDSRRLFDAYHWLNDSHCADVAPVIREIVQTSELVLDEYEKVESIRQQSAQAMQAAEQQQKELLREISITDWDHVQNYVDALQNITKRRGALLTIRDYRYIDIARIDEMGQQLLELYEQTAQRTAEFLISDQALRPFTEQLEKLDQQAQAATTVAQLAEPVTAMDAMGSDLDMLSSLMASLKIDDATQRTAIVEAISEIYVLLNQAKARAQQRRRNLGSAETVAQFGAQFKLFSQSITNALGMARDPESCDEQLSRLLVQLEELESQFGDHDEFLNDILSKREELLESFQSHKQSLLDERQRRAQSLQDAAVRILESVQRRTVRIENADELNAFFAADPLILKLRELSARLRDLHDNVKADDIEARLKAARDKSVRSLRDKSDLFEEGGNVIKLGPRHRFSVNTQELDLTLLPRGDELYFHLTGTDFLEPLKHQELEQLRAYWQTGLESESSHLYRAEYLAALVLEAADANNGFTLDELKNLLNKPDQLTKLVRDFMTPRYKEGYQKGIHDHDAALILTALIPLRENAYLLRYPPEVRGFAAFFWNRWRNDVQAENWPERARTSANIRQLFGSQKGLQQLSEEVNQAMAQFLSVHDLAVNESNRLLAAEYLVEELCQEHIGFEFSKYARELFIGLKQRMSTAHMWDTFKQALERLRGRPDARWLLVESWLQGMVENDPALQPIQRFIPETIPLFLIDNDFAYEFTETSLQSTVEGLLGEHGNVRDGVLQLAVDQFFSQVQRHRHEFIPGLQRYLELRQSLLDQERSQLRVEEFKPQPLTSFVRNRLINEVYLPLIGDNLAKQMGTVGDNKRSDLMGMLMLISPPGYGKTTLMEYVADRLGLIFMKINGPALGHEVRSLDPVQAPDATSRQELEKLNLALEMGSNVMLYVDDIQHTHPEFLQKFISLCDGTRRIEGVWRGRTKTYDMRGRKFCVVMAGNPYTESGEVFKIPDMLANRADIYNLGDVLGGMQDAFALSYIENCLTSNTVLAPLATRDLKDLYLLADKAQGKEVSTNALSYSYSGAEVNEITSVLACLMQVRDVLLKVNLQYIASAAQADEYRTEPPFKLQGSYRNMAKIAEKVSSVMNQAELEQLIDDHYRGEAQLLTTGAEENLLKLAELRAVLTEEQAQRWQQIKQDYLRHKAMGGADSDVGQRVVGQLVDLAGNMGRMADNFDKATFIYKKK